jgi:hypothetical protein
MLALGKRWNLFYFVLFRVKNYFNEIPSIKKASSAYFSKLKYELDAI